MIANAVEAAPALGERWNKLIAVYEELIERETLEDCEIRKPSWSQFVKAFEALEADHEMAQDADDPAALSEKLIELYPKLER